MSTYKIEVSADSSANPQSSRKGLWEEAPGESAGYDRARADKAAKACLKMEGISAARVVDEATAEVVASYKSA